MPESQEASWTKFSTPRWQSGPLLKLPNELRFKIWNLLLLSKQPEGPTFGAGSGISTSIMATCRAINLETSPVIYSTQHTIKYSVTGSSVSQWRQIPMKALRSLHNIRLEMAYTTKNRGDCETLIIHSEPYEDFAETVALQLSHSNALQTLHIEILNESQRKRGPKPLRTEAVYKDMYKMLLPFAELPARQHVTVGGFDTIDFVEMFEDMREHYKDTDHSEGVIERYWARALSFK